MPILINGTSGNDIIDLRNDLRGGFEVWAGAGDDRVDGSPQSDLIIEHASLAHAWIQGSVESGLRAAKEVAERIG